LAAQPAGGADRCLRRRLPGGGLPAARGHYRRRDRGSTGSSGSSTPCSRRRLLHPHTPRHRGRQPMSTQPAAGAAGRSASLYIEQVELIRVAMPLKKPFTTSFGTTTARDVVLVRVQAGGAEGWGELTAMAEPLYNEETVETALIILERHLIPLVLGRTFGHPREVSGAWRAVRRHYMAKAALETACWDAWARLKGIPLARALGGDK